MAAQVLYGRVDNKEIVFANFDETINMTEYLKKICKDCFVEENFLEEEEEITYPIVTFDRISSLFEILTENESTLWAEIKETRGAEKRTELISNMKDVALLKNSIIKMLLQDCPNTEKVLALI